MDDRNALARISSRVARANDARPFDDERAQIHKNHTSKVEPWGEDLYEHGVETGEWWADSCANAEALQQAWFVGVNGGSWRTLPALEASIRQAVRLDELADDQDKRHFWSNDADQLEADFMRGWLAGAALVMTQVRELEAQFSG